jgi:branched-chain amino acid aminotransferase
MRLEVTPDRLLSEIRRTAGAYRQVVPGSGELYIRLQITRGEGAIGLDTALADKPDFTLLVQPCPETPEGKLRAGLRLSMATSLRRNPAQSLDPAWKTGNYLNNLLCLREARSRGADEVVMLNLAGEVTEAAVSNIAFTRGSAMVTPPLAAGILGGITRSLVLGGIAASAGVRAIEETVLPADLGSFEGCFLLSTTKDITPVGSIDDVTFTVGPDTTTARIKAAFGRAAAAYAASHPELAA